ncbi:DNA processing protein [Corynebacterium renale]|uniref:DNA processing protein n=1 Tax=Corynebacterium renale TaxID=1724 RepID=A0A2A9DQP6_9CORY|nr:DNA-processing protein DprA [Corynebacterium renale]PFG28495.1 DNA processing protein [Corynebacterium renale]SQG64910.1 DNA processing protein [Corynebacterium renale]SQI26313.1 DNA processing protein [Corynebacterium renale]STC96679.1 DNA processing protein [Corynebacterium renale]
MTDTTQEIRAWAYLSRVVEGPSRAMNTLLEHDWKPVDLANAIVRRDSRLGALLGETEARHDWNRADLDCRIANEQGFRLIHPGHPEWPQEEFDLAFGYAATGESPHIKTYQSDAAAPHVLWVRGQESLAALTKQALAIVGSRAVSAYGKAVTRKIATDLTHYRYTIISGGALGVDAIAHRAALDAGGPTIAVAACGLDRIYPVRNTELFKDIARTGLVISEYPPEFTPQRHRFLTRNRLVAALTQGTVVTQAPWRSGALNTLSWAAGLGKVTMAIPGPVTEVGSQGCNTKIRDGAAQLVTGADDIHSLLDSSSTVDPDAQYELDFAPDALQQLSRNELRIYDAIPPETGLTAEKIAAAAGFSLPLTVHLLVTLHKKELIDVTAGTWVRRPTDD